MEELPAIPPYPPKHIQSQLLPEEWNSCLDIWIASVQLRLGLAGDKFSKLQPEQSGINYLTSYFLQFSLTARQPHATKQSELDKLSYALIKKLLLLRNDEISSAAYFELLSGGSKAYHQAVAWKKTLSTVWKEQQIRVRKAVESAKTALANSAAPDTQRVWLQKISTLTGVLPETATITVSGADYLDTLTDIYKSGSLELRRAVTVNVFYSFVALLGSKHIGILTDNIYHMKSESDRARKSDSNATTVLSSLVCTTSFLRHFASSAEIATRKHSLIDQLSAYRQDMLHLHPPLVKPRRKKGKEHAQHDDTMHMHKAAQVSQVHELFPDLSNAYIFNALDYYADNVESVIAALLEPESLPIELQDMTISDQGQEPVTHLRDLAPDSTPPLLPERKSVFDNDEFDRLQISSGQLRRGKQDLKYDQATTGDDHARSKAAIMSALAAFDSDDDERDDTYDVADVGGAVDNTVDTDERRPPETDVVEGALFKTWKESPELFARDSKTRASNIRQQLKRETGMSDEQIEGWAIMLAKDKKIQDRLQDKYSAVRAFAGQQKSLHATKWQANPSTDNSENESGPERSNDTRRMGQEGIRGHRDFGRGRGRGGESTAGATGDAATQQARKRKEQGRGRGGRGNLKDARARKVGRGMGPLPSG